MTDRSHELGRYQDVTTHPLIAKVCVSMAQEIYEEVCSGSNVVYKIVGADREDFVKIAAPTLKRAAITLLAQMLADPTVSEGEKADIYEALVLDNSLPKHGTSVVPKKWVQ